MGLQKLSNNDITHGLNRAGITGAVKASQALEAARLFIQSELPQSTPGELTPAAIKSGVIVVKSQNPAAAQRLKEREEELLEYVTAVSGIPAKRLQFRI